MKSGITVVCCYNDLETYEGYLLKSLQKQTEPYELIAIDNRKNTYISCAQAYNTALEKINTEYVCFVHQDVEFISENTLTELLKWNEKCNGIIGVAGASREGRYSCVLEGVDNHIACGGAKINKNYIVQSLDECLFMMPTDIASKVRFDEQVCEGWHLYGVEFCLTASRQDFQSYVVPVPIHHISGGNVDNAFYKTLKKVVRKHCKSTEFLYTTCIRLKKNNVIYCSVYCLFHKCTRMLYKKFIRK